MAEAPAPYDVVIIGGGPGGYNAAIRAGQLGLKVACVEMRATLGGTCLNVGCMPSKALLHASEMFDAANSEFAKIGIEVQPKLNLGQMHKSKDDSVTALTKGIEFLFKKNKADWIKGKGKIVGKGKVEVTAADGSVQTVEAKNIVIATGSEPTPLPGVAFEAGKVIDSTGALSLPAVPKKLIVVGAGIIGLELGADDYMAKPVKRDELLAMLHEEISFEKERARSLDEELPTIQEMSILMKPHPRLG